MTTKTLMLITVSGGIIQEVFCTDPTINLVVIDWDTEGASPDDRGMRTIDGDLVCVSKPEVQFYHRFDSQLLIPIAEAQEDSTKP